MEEGREGSRELSAFRRSYRALVLAAWLIPPIFGLSYLIAIGTFTAQQVGAMLLRPVLPTYCVGAVAASYWYFVRFARPIEDFVANPRLSAESALEAMRRFPMHFWTVFLVYLVLAPVAVIGGGALFLDIDTSPVVWFRVELVSLIVSIIVGLPLFFLFLDLFGKHVGGAKLARAHVTIKTKVILIGALVPLLIDTMIVQYYWTRTGFFTAETFGIWFGLELLAVVGSLAFARSFGQSLQPLQRMTDGDAELHGLDLATLRPASTDELGVLTQGYRRLLESVRAQAQVLELSNDVLRHDTAHGPGEIVEETLGLIRVQLGADRGFLWVWGPDGDDLRLAADSENGFIEDSSRSLRVPVEPPLRAWLVARPPSTQLVELPASLASHAGGSTACVRPLIAKEEKLGLLVCSLADDHSCGEDDRRVVDALATELAIFLYADRLHRSQQALRAQLEHAQRMDAMGRLAGGVAHDFNNLLTAILGSCSLALADLPANDPLRPELVQIQEAARRAGRLTGQLLALSRRTPIRPEVLDVTEVVHSARTLLLRVLPENVALELSEPEDPLWVRADRGQLEQVIVNLVINARDAMPAGGEIRVEVSADDDDAFANSSVDVTLRVTDGGIGIAPEVRQKVFDPFFTTKQEGRGTGLGLSTVYGIVRQSGGRIDLQSEVDVGTTVEINLPRVFGPGEPGTAEKATSRPRVVSGHETVLLVEDDDAVRHTVSRTLRERGYRVTAVSSAEEALSHPDGPFDVLLSDVVMPGMDGRRLAAQLTKRWPGLVVLLMSGYDEVEDALDPGLREWPLIRKPFERDELTEMLGAVIEHREAPAG